MLKQNNAVVKKVPRLLMKMMTKLPPPPMSKPQRDTAEGLLLCKLLQKEKEYTQHDHFEFEEEQTK